MDRNTNFFPVSLFDLPSLSARRAWIEIRCFGRSFRLLASLSARRAWIEMIDYIIDYVNDAVALRKESVDRNQAAALNRYHFTTSLSARRAWIEILVASIPSNFSNGRSPQGERG